RVVRELARGVAEGRGVVAEAAWNAGVVVRLAEPPGHVRLAEVQDVVVEALRVGIPQDHRVAQAEAVARQGRQGGGRGQDAGPRVDRQLVVDDLEVAV